MNPERRQRIAELYERAYARPREERTAFLRDACGCDVLGEENGTMLRTMSNLAEVRWCFTNRGENPKPRQSVGNYRSTRNRFLDRVNASCLSARSYTPSLSSCATDGRPLLFQSVP